MPEENVPGADPTAGGDNQPATVVPDAGNNAANGEGPPNPQSGASLIGEASTGGEGAGGEAVVEPTPVEAPVGAPEAYEAFSTPEGLTIDEGVLAEFAPVAKELNLTQDQAQRLIDVHSKSVQASLEAAERQRLAWRDEVKGKFTDPRVFEEHLSDAKRFIDRYADEGTKRLFNEAAIGDHPGIIDLLANAGKLLREASLHDGAPGGGEKSKDAADVLWGDMFEH